MKIGIATVSDARNKTAWSGLPYYMSQALETQGHELSYFGPLSSWANLPMKCRYKLSQKLPGPTLGYKMSKTLAKSYAATIDRKIAEEKPDALVAPVGSIILSELKSKLPILYTSDATYALMKNYYKQFFGSGNEYSKYADDIEQKAIDKSDYVIYPSSWAAESAIEDYGAQRYKTKVIPYGANLDAAPAPITRQTDDDVCRLLFVGVDWQRKGGPLVLEAVRQLKERGIPYHLTICGCIPDCQINDPNIEVIPFLDKRDPHQLNRFYSLYEKSHFFFMPTQMEAYGIVFCEASAYGLPVITTDTGGVCGAVVNGENGFRLPLDAKGEDYALMIENLWQSPETYQTLSQTARKRYDNVLNWHTWATESIKLVA